MICPNCKAPTSNSFCNCETSKNALAQVNALMLAEHEVMRKRLIELGEIEKDAPICWAATGILLVNLEQSVQEFLFDQMQKMKKSHYSSENFGNN